MNHTKQSEDYLYNIWRKAYQEDDQKTLTRLATQFGYSGGVRYENEKYQEALVRATDTKLDGVHDDLNFSIGGVTTKWYLKNSIEDVLEVLKLLDVLRK